MSQEKLSFEEFKLFYESTEKVTDRRHETNKWNYSVCIAIIVAVAAIFNWGLSNSSFLIVAIIAIQLLSIMAALFCFLWIGQIRDFKALNNAKFSVLNQMAPNITFGDSLENSKTSYCPFQKEWDELMKVKAIEEIDNQNIIALKSSDIEYWVPKSFRILFISIVISVSIFLFLNWTKIIESSGLSLAT